MEDISVNNSLILLNFLYFMSFSKNHKHPIIEKDFFHIKYVCLREFLETYLPILIQLLNSKEDKKMNTDSVNIQRFEDFLINKTPNGNKILNIPQGGKQERLSFFREIWTYVIENVLQWTPEDALKYMTMDVIKTMKLDKTLSCIDCSEKDYFYSARKFLSYVYPDTIKYSLTAETIEVYNRITKTGLYKDDENITRIPKSMFNRDENGEGRIRAYILMNYVCNIYLGDLSLKDKYEFFASRKARNWIVSKNLEQALKGFNKPLDYFHESMEYSNNGSNLYYWNYNIKNNI